MPYQRITPNNREVLAATDSITGFAGYPTMTNRRLDVNASASLAGSALPISGATTAVGVAIVDGSGNQITSFGGGTQYTDGGVPPAHPVAATLEWSDGANWQTVSTAKPLPITIAGGLSNPLPVSGTVTANAGSNLNTSLLATSANLTAGSQKTQIVDGSGNVIGATSNALDINIKSGNITSVNVGTITTITPPTTVRYGQITVSVTNTAVQLTAGALTGNGGAIIQALAANTGNVVVGDSGVTTGNGFQLQPGQAMGIDIDNLNRLYVNGTSGDGVCWIGS